jgi:hypothetical protein
MDKACKWTKFRDRVYKNGLAITAGSKAKATHLLLDGGRLAVPDSRNDELLASYARSYLDGEPLYLVELKSSPSFFMMAEFDVKMAGDRTLTEDEVHAVVAVMQSRVIAPAFADRKPDDLSAAVLRVEPKQVEGGFQSGIHMVWRIPVDVATANALRASAVDALESFFGDSLRPANKGGWKGAFDPCVFENNGLRMVGSRKAAACPACRKRPRHEADEEDCPQCHGSGKVDKGRPYSLSYVADAAGALDEHRTRETSRDALSTVLACSIRAVGQMQPWPPSALLSVAPAPRSVVKRQAKVSESGRGEVSAGVFDEICLLVCSLDPMVPTVTGVKLTEKGDAFFVHTNSLYCPNKQAEHTHSTTYFVISAKGWIKQKCFCRQPDVRPGGGVPCGSYSGKPAPIPKESLEKIFSSKVLGTERKAAKREKLGSEISSEQPQAFTPNDFVVALKRAKFRFAL